MLASRKRLTTILTIGILLAFCAWFYTQHFLLRPMGNGPAGPPVDRSEFTSEWSQASVRLIGLGDSITAGFGAASPEHSFFNRLLKNPEDEFADMQGSCLSRVLPNIESENLAISGSTSLEHLFAIEQRLQVQSPNVFGLVVITTGGNDVIHSYGRSPPREGAMYGATLDQALPWIDAFRARLDSIDRYVADCVTALGPIGDSHVDVATPGTFLLSCLSLNAAKSRPRIVRPLSDLSPDRR